MRHQVEKWVCSDLDIPGGISKMIAKLNMGLEQSETLGFVTLANIFDKGLEIFDFLKPFFKRFGVNK